jgi:hypothetical protein
MRKISTEKNQSDSRASCCQLRKLQLMMLFMMICLGCAVSNAGTSRLYPPTKDETGVLRVAQVVQTATREEILRLGVHLQHLLASGLKDSDFKDGSLAIGRIYCCHESTEEGTAMWFYVPPDMPVNSGDIVVIRMGRESTKSDPGAVNTVIEVREKKDAPDSKCSWDPPNDTLWTRVLYCTWMPAEGWTLKNGLHKTWLKRASDTKAQ